ncbi:MAG: DUF1007 family protein [Pseudomonadota bacterium]
MFARVSFLVAVGGLMSASPLLAHPHVFVDAQTGFTFNAEGELEALRITWTYDAFTSLTLFDILDLDKDNDGQLDEADRAAIVAGETEWAEGYKGDTYLEQNGEAVALTRPKNGMASYSDDRITVSFDLPLATPLDTMNGAVLKLYDPNYYYAYTVVAMYGDLPSFCTADIKSFRADEATSELQAQLALLSREETPAQEDVGRLFADEVALTCG